MKDNFNFVIETEKELFKIVEETLRDKYGYINIENEKAMRLKYKDEYSEDAKNDLYKIIKVLKKVYNNNDFDCYCTVFVAACNLCFEYALINIIDSDRVVDSFAEISDKEIEQNFLKEFGRAIFSQGTAEDNMINFLMDQYSKNEFCTALCIYDYIYGIRKYYQAVEQKDEKLKDIAMRFMYHSRINLISFDRRFFDYISPVEKAESRTSIPLLPYIEYKDSRDFLESYKSYKEKYEEEFTKIKTIFEKNFAEEIKNTVSPGIADKIYRAIFPFSDKELQLYRSLADEMLDKALYTLNIKSEVEEISKFIDKTSTPYDRALAINHPLKIWNSRILDELNRCVEAGIMKNQLEKEKEEKISMINDFSHRYGKHKESYLKEIAEYLLNVDSPEIRNCGRLALYEVSRKYNIDKDVEILKDKFSDNHEFLGKIRKSTKCSEGNSNLKFIIDETIKSCIITLLYDKTFKGRKLRYKLFEKENPEDIADILCDFEENVMVNENDTLEWLKEQNIVDLRYNIDGLWNDLYLYENDYSAVFLTGILSELIFNAIKYANQEKPIEILFSSNEDFLIINEANTIANNFTVSDSGKGIVSANNLIKRFHEPLNLKFEPITCIVNENVFYEQIVLSKKLFVEE